MFDAIRSFVRFVWPPHHTAPAEELHAWRKGVSVATTVNAALLAAHILMVMGGTEPYFPGFVQSDDYARNVARQTDAELRRLRGEILRFHVDYCKSTGELAASYNARLNDLLTLYNDMGGNAIQLPDCQQVRSGGGE